MRAQASAAAVAALVALAGFAAAFPAAAAGGPVGPYPVNPPLTPRWVDLRHDGNVTDFCCSAFFLYANATDPDGSGLYDTLDARFRANSTPDATPLSPAPFPIGPGVGPFPERYQALATANLTAYDAKRRDTFDNLTVDANATLRTVRFGNASLRVAAHCENGDRWPLPERCAVTGVDQSWDPPSPP